MVANNDKILWWKKLYTKKFIRICDFTNFKVCTFVASAQLLQIRQFWFHIRILCDRIRTKLIFRLVWITLYTFFNIAVQKSQNNSNQYRNTTQSEIFQLSFFHHHTQHILLHIQRYISTIFFARDSIAICDSITILQQRGIWFGDASNGAKSS